MCKNGARGKYKVKETPKLAYELACKFGHDTQIWEGLQINPTTFYRWWDGNLPKMAFNNLKTEEEIENRRNEFSQGIKKGKAIFWKTVKSTCLNTIYTKAKKEFIPAAWLLERKFSNDYAKKEHHTLASDKKNPLIPSIKDAEKLSIDELKKQIEDLQLEIENAQKK